MKIALVIYFAISGTTIPWPHKVIWYPSMEACRAAMPKEVAEVNKKYFVAQAGCVDPKMARKR